jgi:hypothetical protein
VALAPLHQAKEMLVAHNKEQMVLAQGAAVLVLLVKAQVPPV